VTAPSRPPAPPAPVVVNPDLDPRTAAIQVLTDLQAIKARLAVQDHQLQRIGLALERHRLELIRIKRDLAHGPLAARQVSVKAQSAPPPAGRASSARPKPRSA
jgi:hypothetical protein